MSLHDTTEIAKKVGITLSLLLGVFFMVLVFTKVGIFIQAALFPPKIPTPTEAYGKLPPISFPQSNFNNPFTYSIDTVNGSLPQNFPDRLIVYPMIMSEPSLLDLKNAQQNISSLQFNDASGNPINGAPVGGNNYEWEETTPDQNGFENNMIYNIVTQNFTMSSDYLTQLSVIQAQSIQDLNYPSDVIPTVQSFLSNLNSFTSDIDFTLTQSPPAGDAYTTTPLLYSVTNGQLTPTTALSTAQVIRVDLYQKEIDYSLNAGENQNPSQLQNFTMQLPILYPHPPYSTMNFFVASGQNNADVVSANFNHQTINLQSNNATYPIKSAEQAFDDLKNGKGYIAAYSGTGNQIVITNVFLAYYMGATPQNYLTPIVVFEGQNGFFAYVPAISDDAIQ